MEPASVGPFYLYDFEISRLCNPPDKLQRFQERAALPRTGGDWAQHTGPEVFFDQQLIDHPLRTLNPDEAKLFV
eukprot:scaffold294243_cov45-Prasinocladus_malaysianus.AAC.1